MHETQVVEGIVHLKRMTPTWGSSLVYANAGITNVEENSVFCILHGRFMFCCAQHTYFMLDSIRHAMSGVGWGGVGWGNSVIVLRRRVLLHSGYMRHATSEVGWGEVRTSLYLDVVFSTYMSHGTSWVGWGGVGQ